jgi:hypothetical protein
MEHSIQQSQIRLILAPNLIQRMYSQRKLIGSIRWLSLIAHCAGMV